MKKATQDNKLWVLETPSPIAPGSEFKFRINKGMWMEAPEDAPNKRGGNLVFGHDYDPPRLVAEMVGPRHIRALLSGKGGFLHLMPP